VDGESADGAVDRRIAAFVVNSSRVHDLRGFWHTCERAAAARGLTPPLLLATSTDDRLAEVAGRALKAGAGLVFAVGGDGTVRACAQALAGSGIRLAIIPRGSANLTANALGIPPRLSNALAVGFDGQDRRIDLATANGVPFAAMAGIGIDAAVVDAASNSLKRFAGWPAYAAAAVSKLTRKPVSFAVQLDDAEPIRIAARSVAVGNCGILPGGFSIMPQARLDDGQLDVAVLAPTGLLGWASIGLRVILGSSNDDGQLQRHRAQHVEIHADAECPRQIDGEVVEPGTSLTVRVLPDALFVRVPNQMRGGPRPG